MRRLFRRENDIATSKRSKRTHSGSATLVRGTRRVGKHRYAALDRERENRYETAAELGRDLDAFVKRTSKGST